MKTAGYRVIAGMAAFGLLGLGLGTLPITPCLVYNASPSVPLGYYRIRPVKDLALGDLVLVQTPDPVRALASARRYLPDDVPMLKTVAALSRDEVCARGLDIFINGSHAATRQVRDPSGRPMPFWQGCIRLHEDDVFLLNKDVPLSFDGRYFGIVKRQLIRGQAVPL